MPLVQNVSTSTPATIVCVEPLPETSSTMPTTDSATVGTSATSIRIS